MDNTNYGGEKVRWIWAKDRGKIRTEVKPSDPIRIPDPPRTDGRITREKVSDTVHRKIYKRSNVPEVILFESVPDELSLDLGNNKEFKSDVQEDGKEPGEE